MVQNASNPSIPFQGPLPGIDTLASQIPDNFGYFERSPSRIPKQFYSTQSSVCSSDVQEVQKSNGIAPLVAFPGYNLYAAEHLQRSSTSFPPGLSSKAEALMSHPTPTVAEYNRKHFLTSFPNEYTSETSSRTPTLTAITAGSSTEHTGCEQRNGTKIELVRPHLNELVAEKEQDTGGALTISKRMKKAKAIRGRRTSSNSSIPCKICNQLYSRKDNLRAHQRVHSGEKPYSCNECSVQFRWLGALRSHQASHRRRTSAAQKLASVSSEHNKRESTSKFIKQLSPQPIRPLHPSNKSSQCHSSV